MILDHLKNYWDSLVDAVRAPDELKKAIESNDLEGALTAISHAQSPIHIYDCETIRLIGKYSKQDSCNPKLLNAMRSAVYRHFDENPPSAIFEENRQKEYPNPYKDPLRVYVMAAYMNDTMKLKYLYLKGINPDAASDHKCVTESLVMGTARLGLHNAMKEVIRQGASLDRGFGFDEFPPIHAFGKPLFHIMHPGVTEALNETGNERIIEAVKRATDQIEPEPPSPQP